MAGGRILVQGKDEGSGFALTPRVVLTANHVVRNREAPSLQFATEAGRRVPVERVERDDDRDIAVLHLSEDVPDVLRVGHAVERAAWQVETRPRGNDPQLTGTVSAARRPFKNAQGHETDVMQLLVEQELGDYRGYSGSPVVLQSPPGPGAVIGVLVEQLRWRIPAQNGLPIPPASNLLYAIPIQDVLNQFGITALSVAPPADAEQRAAAVSLKLRVFLSSPGDVTDERALAREVIERLENERAHRDKLRLEVVAWDKPGVSTAMPAHLEPQEALEQGLWKPSACDIVVVIFGYRMGTRLSEKHHKPNGEPYWSGTEYEYLDALHAARQHDGVPKVLVYRKQGAPAVSFEDPQLEEKLEQWKRVQAFFADFRNPDGSFRSSYKEYKMPTDCKELLDQDLQVIVAQRLEKEPAKEPSPPTKEPDWTKSPYPGLRPFSMDEAPIFFGRDRETDELVQRLSGSRNHSIVVVGASGSGKSSLVAAGLLPRLRNNAVPGSQDWILDIQFTPGQIGDDALMALASQLAPKLAKHGWHTRELAAEISKKRDGLDELVELVLRGRPAWAELLLFIDQFEELFTLGASCKK